MEETQSFRLIGTTEIVKVPIQHIGGRNVIYWDSIEKVFPGVKCVKNGDAAVPRCIEYFPGVVLDIVVSSAQANLQAGSFVEAPSLVPTATSALSVGRTGVLADHPSDSSSEDKIVQDLQVTSALAETSIGNIGTHSTSTSSSIVPPSGVKTSSKPALSFIQVVKLASKKANEFDGQVQQQELSAQMAHMIKLQEAPDAKQEEISQLQKQALLRQERMEQLQKLVLDHQEEMNQLQKACDAKQDKMNQLQKKALDQQEEMKQLALDHHEEIKQLQIQALGQLAVLQDRVKVVLTQTYELHEYPIPRLFVVLPQDPSGWDAVNPFSNKFRLYFLCECGEHTKSISSKTEISHDIHFAKHEGYEIVRPSEFFQQYGPYVLTILKMLKFGVSIAGVAVPAISHLVTSDAVDQATAGLQQLRDNIEPGMDHVIDWMDKVSVNEGEAVDEFAKQMEKKEALEGADLRKLDTFLKDKDGNKVLGNLYRTVTDEGHVKWVCIDHYRDNYQESTAQDFQRMLDIVKGSFNKSIGRVVVTLQSRVLAEQLSLALGKARSVYELDVVFDWACTTRDLEVLEGALKTSRVTILRLSIRQFRTSNLSSTSSQYGVLFCIKGLPNMRIFHVVLSNDVAKILSILPKTPSRLCKLSIEATPGLVAGKEFAALAEAIKTNSTVTTLDLQSNSIGDDGAKALAEALKTNSTVTTLDLQSNSIGDDGAKALAEALKTNSTVTTLDLNNNKIGFEGALTLIIASKIHSLTTLNLQSSKIGDNGAKALAEALKTNSTVTTLNLQSNSIGDDGAKALAEALKTNKTLTTLDLHDNKIGSDGANALAKALKINKTVNIIK